MQQGHVIELPLLLIVIFLFIAAWAIISGAIIAFLNARSKPVPKQRQQPQYDYIYYDYPATYTHRPSVPQIQEEEKRLHAGAKLLDAQTLYDDARLRAEMARANYLDMRKLMDDEER
jgi:hypothetical protein